MKKITSLLLISLLLFTCTLILPACSSTQPEDKLIGTWEYKITSGSQTYASSTYIFSKSSGEYSATLKMGSASGRTQFKATYEVQGNKIIFTLLNGNTITESYSINGNVLTIDGIEYIKK